jgi:tRNA U34 5-methylaminomethyl-2-thiouridine-forming methyltransferase MnmC
MTLFSVMDDIKLILSDDGSHTLFVPSLNENYHSTHGAISESMHVYIQTGLKQIEKQSINILEVGFGTGLNALLTIVNAPDKTINYTGVEKFPLPQATLRQLNYGKTLGQDAEYLFEKMQNGEWDVPITVTPNFSLTKIAGDFRQTVLTKEIDLVYFDAFGPDKQIDLWNSDVFAKIYSAMLPGGLLVTYCAKGAVRRSLQHVGFVTERLPGPPRKREMLRATKR